MDVAFRLMPHVVCSLAVFLFPVVRYKVHGVGTRFNRFADETESDCVQLVERTDATRPEARRRTLDILDWTRYPDTVGLSVSVAKRMVVAGGRCNLT